MRHAFALSAVLLLPGVAVARPSPPNIVIILADDMGIDAVSCLNEKSGVKTPHLDRLAAEGMTFTDAHSPSGVCSPSRYGVLTGRYAWRTRLKRGIVGKWQPPLIDAERLTLAEHLRDAGYATACIGKWHLGWHWPKRSGGFTTRAAEIAYDAPIRGGPLSHGFERYFGDDVPNWPPYVWIENDRALGVPTETMEEGTLPGVRTGPAMPGWRFDAVLPRITKACVAFIEEQAGTKQPFFLLFSMTSPHTPIAPSAEFRGRSGVSAYADFLIETDASVGRILGALKGTGQAERTLVVFTADNGTSPKCAFDELEQRGVHLREHWRGWKADAFEGGHRVPFIVRWPGTVRGGTRCAEVISLVDLMATLAEVTGRTLPGDAAEDSLSLVPLLRGAERSGPLHEAVICHSSGGCFAVRRGRWKLMLCRGSGGWSPPTEAEARRLGLPSPQLYDLDGDAREQRNVASDHPEIVRELTRVLRRFVERGRSTPGPPQSNTGGTSWPGLPWHERSEPDR